MARPYVYAAESDSDGIEFWSINDNGSLNAVGGVGNNKIPTAGRPEDLALSADCRTLYSAEDDIVEYWNVNAESGAVTAIGGPGNNRYGSFTDAIVAHPFLPELFGNVTRNDVREGWPGPIMTAWKINGDGALADPRSPFPNANVFDFGAVGALSVSPDGRYLFGAIPSLGRLITWSLSADGSPSAPDKPENESGIPTAFKPLSLAVSPNGKFLYSAGGPEKGDLVNGNIEFWSIGQDGGLSAIGGAGNNFAISGAVVNEMAITPDGRFLFGAHGGRISRWQINPDGSLYPQRGIVEGAETPTGEDPNTIAISPDGKYLYAGEKDQIEFWAINTADGSLNAIGGPGNNKIKTGLGSVQSLVIG